MRSVVGIEPQHIEHFSVAEMLRKIFKLLPVNNWQQLFILLLVFFGGHRALEKELLSLVRLVSGIR